MKATGSFSTIVVGTGALMATTLRILYSLFRDTPWQEASTYDFIVIGWWIAYAAVKCARCYEVSVNG